jgi:indolepyruvate ferredoxin oxidoreductase alpha subunit
MTVFILDNAAVAMTGAQDSMTTGEPLVELLRGLGVTPDHLHVIEPLARRHDANVELIRGEIAHRGLSVIVSRRPCIHLKRKGVEDRERERERQDAALAVAG